MREKIDKQEETDEKTPGGEVVSGAPDCSTPSPRTEKVLSECHQMTGDVDITDLAKMEQLARKLEEELTESVSIARRAIEAVETVYGHAQHCDCCQSFEIAQSCRNELHGFDRLNLCRTPEAT